MVDDNDECLEWIRKNQVRLYQDYLSTIGGLQEYLPKGLDLDVGFRLYSIIRYEAMRLVLGSDTLQ